MTVSQAAARAPSHALPCRLREAARGGLVGSLAAGDRGSWGLRASCQRDAPWLSDQSPVSLYFCNLIKELHREGAIAHSVGTEGLDRLTAV
jgi:hypothetical protein